LQCNIFVAVQHKKLTIAECFEKLRGIFLSNRRRYLVPDRAL
jgi:hypothetical protein